MDSGNFQREINGLSNLGNTCYINSVLQSICLNEDMCFFLLSDKYKKKTKKTDSKFLTNFIRTLRAMYDVKKVIAPISLINTLDDEIEDFNIHCQQDAMDILLSILDKIDTILYREVNVKIKQIPNCDEITVNSKKEWSKFLQKNYSEIKKYYYGQLCSITRCDCSYQSIIYEPIAHLPLSLPVNNETDYLNITDCFKKFNEDEKMEGENQYSCSKCNKKSNAIKKLFVKITPPHLIIQLKRFYVTKNYDTVKLHNFVDFPFDLDISEIVYNGKNKDCRYSLYSVINHIGNFSDGHYFTFSKVGNKWYCFNDENVQEILQPTISNKYAYILFYKKIC